MKLCSFIYLANFTCIKIIKLQYKRMALKKLELFSLKMLHFLFRIKLPGNSHVTYLHIVVNKRQILSNQGRNTKFNDPCFEANYATRTSRVSMRLHNLQKHNLHYLTPLKLLIVCSKIYHAAQLPAWYIEGLSAKLEALIADLRLLWRRLVADWHPSRRTDGGALMHRRQLVIKFIIPDSHHASA